MMYCLGEKALLAYRKGVDFLAGRDTDMYDLKPYLQQIEAVIQKGPYRDTWESLSGYRVPEWYRRGKFGIFIHWGIYSVPAFGSEWYSRNMYIQGSKEFEHHVETYGKHSEFGYKDFIPMFRAERFDPEEWAGLFADAGARYVVPVAEHHDGFQMYKSGISEWNAFQMGPERDVLGELKESLEKRGLITGASSHRIEHWFFMGHGKEFDSDIKDPLQRGDFYWPAMAEAPHFDMFSEPAPTEEFMQDWLVRTCELIDSYRPRLLYFDWWIQHSSLKPYLRKLAAYYYNRAHEWGEETVICYKHDAFLFGTALPDVERGQFADMKSYPWQTDTAIALNSWGYTENNQFKEAKDIICDLVDIVSKNGSMLLNVGPRADGTITGEEKRILLEIGKWLKINGEAVYDAEVWRTFGEGPTKVVEGQFSDGIKKLFTSEDFRFTTAHGKLYVTAMKCSGDGKYCVTSLGRKDVSRKAEFGGIIDSVETLGSNEGTGWYVDEEGLHVETAYYSEKPIVFRVTLR